MAISTKCNQGPPVPGEAPWNTQGIRTNCSSRMTPALRAPLMHSTTLLNTPFNSAVEKLQAAQWLASQSLAVPHGIISCRGHDTCVLQPAASCWSTSAGMAAGRAPLSQGRGPPPDLQGKQLLSSNRTILSFPWPMSAPTAAEDRGSGFYFIFCRPQEKEDFRGI